jgi:hypothetical protein
MQSGMSGVVWHAQSEAMGVVGRLQVGGLDQRGRPPRLSSIRRYQSNSPLESKPNCKMQIAKCKMQNVKGEEHKATGRTNEPSATHSEFALLRLHSTICNLQFAIWIRRRLGSVLGVARLRIASIEALRLRRAWG